MLHMPYVKRCAQICPVQEECPINVILMGFIHFIKQQYKLSICL